MAEKAIIGWAGGDANYTAASATTYMSFAGGNSTTASYNNFKTTEANAEWTIRESLTLKEFHVRVAAARSTTTTLTVRKNRADTNVAVSFSATGTFTDLSDTVSLADGDEICLKNVTGTGSDNLRYSGVSAALESSGQCSNIMGTAGSYVRINGNTFGFGRGTNTNAATAPCSATASKASFYLSVNGNTARTGRFQKNNANGNQSVSITANTTGLFTDTSNSDSFSAGDTLNTRIDSSTTSYTTELTYTKFAHGTSKRSILLATGSGNTQPGYDDFYPVLGDTTNRSATEGDIEFLAPFAFSIKALRVVINTVSTTTDATATVRINGSSTAVTADVALGQSAGVGTWSGSVSVSQGDRLTVMVGGATDFGVNVNSIALEIEETSAAGVSGTLSATLGATTISSTAKAQVKGTSGITLGATTLTSATAQVQAKASANITLGATTISSTTKVQAKGSAGVTLGDTTLSATAKVQAKASLSATLAATTLVANAGVIRQGTLSATLDPVTITSTAKAKIGSQANITLGAVTLNATGKARVKASANITLDATAISSTGIARQRVFPVSDVTVGLWTNELGQSTNLYASIDEASADDADYAISEELVTDQSSYYEAAFDLAFDPVVHTNHVLSYRLGKVGTDNLDAIVSLRQGASVIASWNHANVSVNMTTFTRTLSTLQAASITDYGDLRLRVEAAAGPAGLLGGGGL